MRLIIFLFLLPISLFPQESERIIWKTDIEEAMLLAVRENKPVFIYFYADWCKVCKRLDQTLFRESETIRALNSFIPVKINGDKNQSAADRYKTRGFPTMVFLDKNGYQLEKSEGGTDGESFRSQLIRVLRKSQLENRVMTALENPKNVTALFEAGLYFSGAGNHEEARNWFMKAWSSSLPDPDRKRPDALYNAAVSSMELKDYAAAVSQWNIYLLQNSLRPSEEAEIRYYRAISYSKLGRKQDAAEDLRFTAANAENRRIRQAAEELKRTLSQSD